MKRMKIPGRSPQWLVPRESSQRRGFTSLKLLFVMLMAVFGMSEAGAQTYLTSEGELTTSTFGVNWYTSDQSNGAFSIKASAWSQSRKDYPVQNLSNGLGYIFPNGIETYDNNGGKGYLAMNASGVGLVEVTGEYDDKYYEVNRVGDYTPTLAAELPLSMIHSGTQISVTVSDALEDNSSSFVVIMFKNTPSDNSGNSNLAMQSFEKGKSGTLTYTLTDEDITKIKNNGGSAYVFFRRITCSRVRIHSAKIHIDGNTNTGYNTNLVDQGDGTFKAYRACGGGGDRTIFVGGAAVKIKSVKWIPQPVITQHIDQNLSANSMPTTIGKYDMWYTASQPVAFHNSNGREVQTGKVYLATKSGETYNVLEWESNNPITQDVTIDNTWKRISFDDKQEAPADTYYYAAELYQLHSGSELRPAGDQITYGGKTLVILGDITVVSSGGVTVTLGELTPLTGSYTWSIGSFGVDSTYSKNTALKDLFADDNRLGFKMNTDNRTDRYFTIYNSKGILVHKPNVETALIFS